MHASKNHMHDYTHAGCIRRMHDYTNQFNMKWKKHQFGGRKVVGQATMFDYWA